MARKAARAAAMQMIYERMMGGDGGDTTLRELIEFEPDADDRAYIDRCVNGVFGNVDELDAKIEAYSVGWTLDRISRVNLAILRLSLFEVLHCTDIPNEVAINEAIQLAQRYSMPDDARFINGVLGQVVRGYEQTGNRPGKTEHRAHPVIIAGTAWADKERELAEQAKREAEAAIQNEKGDENVAAPETMPSAQNE